MDGFRGHFKKQKQKTGTLGGGWTRNVFPETPSPLRLTDIPPAPGDGWESVGSSVGMGDC